MQVHYAIGDLHVYIAARLLCKQRIRNQQHLMREYMQIGLQYSIESLIVVDKKERESERNVHSIPIKKSTIRERERRRRRIKNERRKEKKKTADGSIVFTYLYCLWCMIYHYH